MHDVPVIEQAKPMAKTAENITIINFEWAVLQPQPKGFAVVNQNQKPPYFLANVAV